MDIHISCPKTPLIDPDGWPSVSIWMQWRMTMAQVFFCALQTERNTANLRNGTYGYITAAMCDHDANEKCKGRFKMFHSSTYIVHFFSSWWESNLSPQADHIFQRKSPPSSSSNHIFQVRIMRCLEPGETTDVVGETTDVHLQTHQIDTCFEVEHVRIVSPWLTSWNYMKLFLPYHFQV